MWTCTGATVRLLIDQRGPLPRRHNEQAAAWGPIISCRSTSLDGTEDVCGSKQQEHNAGDRGLAMRALAAVEESSSTSSAPEGPLSTRAAGSHADDHELGDDYSDDVDNSGDDGDSTRLASGKRLGKWRRTSNSESRSEAETAQSDGTSDDAFIKSCSDDSAGDNSSDGCSDSAGSPQWQLHVWYADGSSSLDSE